MGKLSTFTGLTAILNRFVACAAQSFAIYPCFFKFLSPFFCVSGLRGSCWSHPPCCHSAFSGILHCFAACAALVARAQHRHSEVRHLERLDLAFFSQAGAYLTSIPRRGGLEKSRIWFFIPSIGFHGNALQTCMVSAWSAL